MKISLRKANALQAEIKNHLNRLNLTTTANINEFESVESKLAEELVRFKENLDLRTKLNTSLYEIRKAVASANATSGINDLLADVAQTEADIQLYTSLATCPTVTDVAVLIGQLKKIETSTEKYYGQEVITSSLFNKEMIDTFKVTLAALKRSKANMQDNLLAKNVSTTIELSVETAVFLVVQGLLD